ncbi:MAG: hypothetical protein ACI4U2_03340, partial [Christensenellaceae bacterium]
HTSGDEQDVIIRTNSTSTIISVNAPNDTIRFYGEGTLAEDSVFANNFVYIYDIFSELHK